MSFAAQLRMANARKDARVAAARQQTRCNGRCIGNARRGLEFLHD